MDCSRSGYFITVDKFGTYSGSPNADRKTTILSSDGLKIISEQIYSPNKKFIAVADFDRKITSVNKLMCQKFERGSNKYCRQEIFWTMDGCYEMLGLSNDGEHLVVGYKGLSILPLNYKEDQVMLSFFHRGALENRVSLHQFISNFSKLERTATGYRSNFFTIERTAAGNRWGKYVGLNAAGHYVIEDAEGKKMFFDVRTGKTVDYGTGRIDKGPQWKTYQDVMRCYEFQYPAAYHLKDNLDIFGMQTGDTSLEGQKKERITVTTMEWIGDPDEESNKSFEEFVINKVKAHFQADGSEGSSYISNVLKKEIFTNAHNLKSVELYLLRVNETYLEDDKKGKLEKETIGPLYAVSIAQPDESLRVLFFLLNYDDKNLSPEKAVVKEIVNTVRILR